MIGLQEFPGLSLQSLPIYVLLTVVASLRIGSFLVASPFFGTRMVPLPIRIVFSFCMGIWVLGFIQFPPLDVILSSQLISIALQELAIGLSCGMILSICFAAVIMAGEKIAASSGLGFAAQIDPDSGGQTPVVSKIFSIFLTVLFLSWNGHLVVLRVVLDTYKFLPVGSLPDMDALVSGGITAAGSMFFAAAIIMLPITGFLVAINLAVGVISRSSPQMNLFAVGFPISMIVIFVLLYLWVDALGHSLTELSQTGVESVTSVLEVMING